MRPGVRSLLIGQLSFFAAMAVCFIVLPSGDSNRDGLSYFGSHRASLIPYTLGFMAASWFAAKAATELAPSPRTVARLLRLLAALLLGVLVTPYDYGQKTGLLHEAFGITLFFTELAIVGFLLVERAATKLDLGLFVLLFGAGWLSMLSVPSVHILHIEVLAQIIYQSLFSLGVVRLLQARTRTQRS